MREQLQVPGSGFRAAGDPVPSDLRFDFVSRATRVPVHLLFGLTLWTVLFVFNLVGCVRGGECRFSTDCQTKQLCKAGFCLEDTTPPPPRLSQGILVGVVQTSKILSQQSTNVQVEVKDTKDPKEPRTATLVKDGEAWKTWLPQTIAITPQDIRLKAFNEQNKLLYEAIMAGLVIPEKSHALSLGFMTPKTLSFSEEPIPRLAGLWIVQHVLRIGGVASIQLQTAVDIPGDEITFSWQSKVGTFSQKNTPTTSWTAPSQAGNYELIATLQHKDGGTATLKLNLLVADNPTLTQQQTLPTVQFHRWPLISHLQAQPSILKEGQTSTLSLQVQNPDETEITYQWKDIDCGGSFNTNTIANPLWTAPAVVNEQQTCRLSVIVKDAREGTHQKDIFLLLQPPNTTNKLPRYTQLEQSNNTAKPGEKIVLRVAVVDDDGHKVSFYWKASSGQLGTPQSTETSSEITWTTPASGCPHTITVTATDERQAENTHNFTIGCVP